jgi:hypothetical protein
MQPKANSHTDAVLGQRLLLITLTLEAAIQADDWREVTALLSARASLIEGLESVPQGLLIQIGIAEERMLTTLRQRLVAVRGDIRNLTAALRISSPYSRAQRSPSFSLAG